MFKQLTDIIYDKKLKLIVFENKVNINNYEDVLIFDDTKVLIKTKTKNVKITGSDLVISRLENKEVLIEGEIISIEFRWYFDKLLLGIYKRKESKKVFN